MKSFVEELNLLIRARYPIVYVPTSEEERLERAIAEASGERNLYCWDFVEGFQVAGIDKGKAKSNPLQALEFIEENRTERGAVYVLRDYHRFLEDISISRKLRNLARRLRSEPKTVLITAPRIAIPDDLAEELTVLEFSLPTFAEIQQELEQLLSGQNLNRSTKEELIKACQGLTLNRIRQVLAKTLVKENASWSTGGHGASNQTFAQLSEDLDLILEEKRQKIRQTQILEFYPASENISDIGGLGDLKEWLIRRGAAFGEQARRYGLPAPRGLLLVGIQGTGKSLTAKAIAHHWHLPLLRLDVGRLFGGLVGESESRTRQMIQLAEALAPCVLWIDEVDKAFGGSGGQGDAGTSRRVFGAFLTWMAEKKAPVFVVATANDIQNLPPELLRKGRFDEIFFIDLPSQEERKEIFEVHLNKLRPTTIRQYDLSRLAYEAPEFSGAEIEQCLIEAMHAAFSQNRDFTGDDILHAISQMVPLARTCQEQIQQLQSWARSGKARLASRRVGGLLDIDMTRRLPD